MIDARLEQVAGAPTLRRTTVGSTARTGSAFEDVTLFAVIQFGTDLTAAFSSLAYQGVVNSADALHQLGPAAGNSTAFRADIPGGSSNVNFTQPGRVANSRTCCVLRLTAGLTAMMGRSSGTAWASRVLTPGTGFTNRNLTIAAATSVGDVAMDAWYYARALTDDDVRRVLGWTSLRYGTPRPA